MPQRSTQPLLVRLTSALIVLAVLVGGAVAPVAALRCEIGCVKLPAEAVDTCCPAGRAPERQQQPTPTGDHEERDAGCCPAACQACTARPLFVASGSAPAAAERPVLFLPASVSDAVDTLDVAFAIFHPPKA